MNGRLKELLALLLLGLAISLAPIACGSSGGSGDGNADTINSMTPG